MVNSSWSESNNKLEKTFPFEFYSDMIFFVHEVMQIADKQNHHPEMNVYYDYVKVFITNYESGSISDKCHRFAIEVDKIMAK